MVPEFKVMGKAVWTQERAVSGSLFRVTLDTPPLEPAVSLTSHGSLYYLMACPCRDLFFLVAFWNQSSRSHW